MKTNIVEPHKSKLGLDANMAVMLMYILIILMTFVSWIPFVGVLGNLLWIVLPVVLLIMDRESEFIKYQAVQALIIGLVRTVISIVLGIPQFIINVFFDGGILALLLWLLSSLISLVIVALTVYLLLMALGYKQVELPGLSTAVVKLNAAFDKAFKKKQ